MNKWLNFGGDPNWITYPGPDTDPDLDRDKGKTNLGRGMHCPNASSRIIITSPARTVAKYCDECVCLCVCVSVRQDISPELHARCLPNFCACCVFPWLGPLPACLR